MMLLLIPIYKITLDSARDHSLYMLERDITDAAEAIDSSVGSLLRLDYQLDEAYVSSVKVLHDEQFSTIAEYRMLQTQKLFTRLTNNIEVPKSFFALFHNNSRVITSGITSTIYKSADSFSAFMHFEGLSDSNLRDELISRTQNISTIPATSVRINFSLPEDYFTVVTHQRGSSLTVCAAYSLNDIRNLLNLDALPADTYARLDAADGSPIFRIGGNHETPGETVIRKHLDILGATLTFGIPASYFTAQVAGVLRLIIIYISFAAGLGILLSFLMAIYNNSPLYHLMKFVRNSDAISLSPNDEFRYLAELNRHTEHMKAEWQNQMAFMQQAIHDSHLARLLTGSVTISDQAALERFLPELNGPCRIALVDIGYDRSEKEAERIILLIFPLFEKNNLHLIYLGYGQLFALFAEDQLELFEHVFEETNEVIKRDCATRACTTISGSFTGVEQLRSAFQSVQMAAIHSEHSISYVRETEPDAQRFKSPDLDTLVSSVRCGNSNAAERVITDSLAELSSKGGDYQDVVQLFDMLRSALITTANELNEPADIVGFVGNAPILEQFERLRSTALELAEHQSHKKAAPSYKNELLAYIDAHFTDCNTYAGSVAEAFNISTKQVYRVVREMTGSGFSDYLENLRIQHAIHLLNDTEDMVSEVAIKCGFNSVSTFYKAFKRVHGISPSVYRSQADGERPPELTEKE